MGTLTVNPQEGDVYNYSGYIADWVHAWAGLDTSTVPPVALVKTGPGTQQLAAGAIWQWGYFVYTGGTTVQDGVLDISAVNSVYDENNPGAGIQIGFTPNGSIALEGGTLLASGLLQDTITRGATTSGTLEAGGTVYPILEVSKAVDIAAAVIDDGHTLSLTSGGVNVIDTVTGSGGDVGGYRHNPVEFHLDQCRHVADRRRRSRCVCRDTSDADGCARAEHAGAPGPGRSGQPDGLASEVELTVKIVIPPAAKTWLGQRVGREFETFNPLSRKRRGLFIMAPRQGKDSLKRSQARPVRTFFDYP